MLAQAQAEVRVTRAEVERPEPVVAPVAIEATQIVEAAPLPAPEPVWEAAPAPEPAKMPRRCWTPRARRRRPCWRKRRQRSA